MSEQNGENGCCQECKMPIFDSCRVEGSVLCCHCRIKELEDQVKSLVRISGEANYRAEQYLLRKNETQSTGEKWREKFHKMKAQADVPFFGKIPITIDPSMPDNCLALASGNNCVMLNFDTGIFEAAEDFTVRDEPTLYVCDDDD